MRHGGFSQGVRMASESRPALSRICCPAATELPNATSTLRPSGRRIPGRGRLFCGTARTHSPGLRYRGARLHGRRTSSRCHPKASRASRVGTPGPSLPTRSVVRVFSIRRRLRSTPLPRAVSRGRRNVTSAWRNRFRSSRANSSCTPSPLVRNCTMPRSGPSLRRCSGTLTSSTGTEAESWRVVSSRNVFRNANSG